MIQALVNSTPVSSTKRAKSKLVFRPYFPALGASFKLCHFALFLHKLSAVFVKLYKLDAYFKKHHNVTSFDALFRYNKTAL